MGDGMCYLRTAACSKIIPSHFVASFPCNCGVGHQDFGIDRHHVNFDDVSVPASHDEHVVRTHSVSTSRPCRHETRQSQHPLRFPRTVATSTPMMGLSLPFDR